MEHDEVNKAKHVVSLLLLGKKAAADSKANHKDCPGPYVGSAKRGSNTTTVTLHAASVVVTVALLYVDKSTLAGRDGASLTNGSGHDDDDDVVVLVVSALCNVTLART